MERKLGNFFKIEEIIKDCAKNLENAVLISAFDFIEHNEKLFGDLWLHPSDKGFEQYFEGLCKEINKIF